MLIAVPTELPDIVVQVELNSQRHQSTGDYSDYRSQEAVSTDHYMGKEDRAIQMARHPAVETKDAKRQEGDWKVILKRVPTYELLRPQVLDLLRNFTDIWDGHMGIIRTVKHRIVFHPPGSNPVHTARYRAGTAACQLEKTGIDKVIRMRVFYPPQTEWASPIVYMPKKNVTLCFCVD